MSHAFITHGDDQLDNVLLLHEAFRSAGIPAKYIQDVETDRSHANQLIDNAALMVVLVSYEAMRSKTVRADVKRARQAGLRLVPVLTDRARLTGFLKNEIGQSLAHSIDDMPAIVKDAQRSYRLGCPIVAIMNLKGGVGKTTLSAQLAGTFQAHNKNRVLLIDFDPQYNLTQLFFPGPTADRAISEDKSVISIFEKSQLHSPGSPSPADRWSELNSEPFTAATREKITHSLIGKSALKGRLDIIFGQFEISKYAFSTNQDGLNLVRQNFLRAVDYYRSQYDLILLDTNPNATFLTRCALQAADRVIAPMFTDIYSLRGLRLLNRVINDQTAEDQRPDLSVLFNAVERREQSDFEADTRNGVFDAQVGFDLSKSVMTSVLPRSKHFRNKFDEDDPPIKRLIAHHGRGGGLRHIRDALQAATVELSTLI